jgi:catechol 2,3-dioxygenase-like lactoylglutathione lyase family enzyme
MPEPTVRMARPTDDLDALVPFIVDGLGLVLLRRFDDDAGSGEVILGRPDAPYQIEFTRPRNHAASRARTAGNLLVPYLPEHSDWLEASTRMLGTGFEPVPSFNPRWDRDGVAFKDPDGYRVVHQNAAWSA